VFAEAAEEIKRLGVCVTVVVAGPWDAEALMEGEP
jgi:hypothetical protein